MNKDLQNNKTIFFLDAYVSVVENVDKCVMYQNDRQNLMQYLQWLIDKTIANFLVLLLKL